MYLYIADGNTQIDFTRSELVGTQYLRPLEHPQAERQRASIILVGPDVRRGVGRPLVTQASARRPGQHDCQNRLR
jgi:hypothetical protein